ncbi:TetR family transcriptional regulator [Sphingomonas corticis]|uniref:TetR/AcrR family transcriptional regulator n=1 Tax=Sphingomonas corticis TaxID=2722791 RepID=A0ABX1CPZ9_9SPHN|nr:TetR/AcrR family transcriptional regulator [Sphingomonas corticis]
MERNVRGRAIDAAAELLREVGAEKLSVRMIADRAGIGTSSMYHYFGNKEDLLLQVALNGFGDLAREMEAAAEPRPGLGPFSTAARAFLEYVAQRPALYELMFDQHLMARHRGLREAERRAFTAFLDGVARDRRFPPELARSIATTFWTLGRGMGVTALSQPGQQLDPAFRAAISEALAYLIDRNMLAEER